MMHRTALVTGASQGIGRSCATALAATGVAVVAGARQTDKLASLVEEIQAVELDVADQASVDAMAKSYGQKIDILVNNAGITADNLGIRLKDADWQSVLDTNLTGAFRCSRAVLRGMMKRRWGRIVNVSSVVGLSGNAGTDRPDQVLGARTGQPKHHRQCRRARILRDRYDRPP